MSKYITNNITKGNDTGYFASSAYFECSTDANVQLKVATNPNNTVFTNNSVVVGLTLYVKFTNTNTAIIPMLKIGDSDAHLIVFGNTTDTIGITPTQSWYPGAVMSFTYTEMNNLGYWQMNDYKRSEDTKVTQSNVDSSSNSWYPVLLKHSASATTETDSVNAAGGHNTVNPCAYNPGVDIFKAPAAEIGRNSTSKLILLVSEGDSADYPSSAGYNCKLTVPAVTETKQSEGGTDQQYSGTLATQGMFRYKVAVPKADITVAQSFPYSLTFSVVVPDFVTTDTPIRGFMFSNNVMNSNIQYHHMFQELGVAAYISSLATYVDMLDTSIGGSVVRTNLTTQHELNFSMYCGTQGKLIQEDSQLIIYFN